MKFAWDKSLSAAIYRVTKQSKFLRSLAMFCSTILLFIMVTAVMMTYGGADAMTPMMARFLGSLITMSVPLLFAWLVSYVVQRLVRRPRPFEAGQGDPLITMTWTGPSFPSAHAAIAFATAVFGLIVFPDIYGSWLFVFAILVSLGRVAVGVHYLLDVIVGAIVGTAAGLYLSARRTIPAP